MVPFTSPAGDYSLLFPAAPQAVPDVPEIPGATMEAYTSGAYGVIAVRAPGVPIPIDQYRDQVLAEAGATLTLCAPYTQQGLAGIELSATTAAGATILSRIIVDGGTLFQIFAAVPGTDTSDPALAAFFSSFQVVPSAVVTATTAVVTPSIVTATTAVVTPTIVTPTIPAVTITPAGSAAPVATFAPVTPGSTIAGPVTPTVITPTAAPAGWIVHTSTSGAVSVAFPVAPALEDVPVPQPDGSTVTSEFATAESAALTYGMSVATFPAGSTFDLEAARDGALQGMGSTLVTSTPVTLLGREGIEYVGTVDVNGTPGSVVARIYVDGVTMYQQIVVGAGALTSASPGVGEFLNSFSFTQAAAS
jgi:hypothetical protein